MEIHDCAGNILISSLTADNHTICQRPLTLSSYEVLLNLTRFFKTEPKHTVILKRRIWEVSAALVSLAKLKMPDIPLRSDGFQKFKPLTESSWKPIICSPHIHNSPLILIHKY